MHLSLQNRAIVAALRNASLKSQADAICTTWESIPTCMSYPAVPTGQRKIDEEKAFLARYKAKLAG